MSTRVARWLAWSLFVLAVALCTPSPFGGGAGGGGCLPPLSASERRASGSEKHGQVRSGS